MKNITETNQQPRKSSRFGLLKTLFVSSIALASFGAIIFGWSDRKKPAPVEPSFTQHPEEQPPPKLLIPGNANQVICTLNGGKESCFADDYLPCQAFRIVDGESKCIHRKSADTPASEPTAEPNTSNPEKTCSSGRLFNGSCWEKHR
ncbi:hypothetical protein [Lyngbya sp. CCY1209]|uniref:hypothetical protein n=1 Tax=Lyngbya sp. CCY1209 TaxID=2886103 RepID=UPI002D215332|nr:hypothetical protein [Lyngbya sp. CCY1209]MEB3886149.1 hypothetical protein [Lyngbya sp. CCY1209]